MPDPLLFVRVERPLPAGRLLELNVLSPGTKQPRKLCHLI